ncbi:m7GpppN-mRNA hydrolase-like [Toxorhynchites rutilus septentrionalis]|uniref:m7GpppN-mRNA hydrolase-like n=1 Tax=Toxorhynchites rutilus septentrionalis TaxID=329112 RepID=UPI002479C4DF|nr:m7GpppN-mRNA hydrolase-like [Toxorhynchites rutilus septentrionalis]
MYSWNHPIEKQILDTLAARYILPMKDRNDLIGICCAIRKAHWHYLDVSCSDEYKKCGYNRFAYQIFRHVPFLQKHIPKIDGIMSAYMRYLNTIPTNGAILLSEDMKHVLLVQSYKGKWGFPQGKAEKEGKEDPFDCAVREVLEEIGYDIRKKASGKFWDVMFTHPSRLYLVPDVPYSTNFRPQTRNEIRRIKWFPIESLPNSNAEVDVSMNGGLEFFRVHQFVAEIQRTIRLYNRGQMMERCRRNSFGFSSNDGKWRRNSSDGSGVVEYRRRYTISSGIPASNEWRS